VRGLRILLKRKGKLSFGIITDAPGIPSAVSYVKRFGSLRKIYALAGYRSPRNCDYLDTRQFWRCVVTKHATAVAEALNAREGRKAVVDPNTGVVTVNEKKIFFFTARQMMKPKPHHLPQWRVYCRRRVSGLLVLLRLNDAAKEIEDCLLLPASKMTGGYVQISPIALRCISRYDFV
jgi:hypothetical protein